MKKIVCILIILQLFLCQLNAQKELRKVDLQLSWLHQFQFAGYYMAKEKGFYKEAGLDVTFKEMNNNVNLSKDVIDGKVNYSVGRSSIILDKIKGDDIVALFATYQHAPLILLTLESSKFTSISDLKNKNIMISNNAISSVSIYAMLTSNGLQFDDLNFQKQTYKLDDLINKKTDALGAYISNEVYQLELKGIPYTIFNPMDYGFDFYDGILFTSKKELNENPVDTYNFYRASLKGWEYAFENISETINIIYNKYNTQNKTLDALLYEAYSLKNLAYVNDIPFGTLDAEKVNNIATIYSILGFVNHAKINLSDFIYNNKLLVFLQEEKEFLHNEKIFFITEEFEPFYVYKKGIAQGIAIDIWKKLTDTIELKTQYETIMNQKSAQNKLQTIEHSLKLQLLHDTTNANDVIYTKPIKTYPYAIATRNDENFITSLTQLDNKNVSIVKNTVLLDKIKHAYPKINFIQTDNPHDALALLSQGKVFATIDILPTLTHVIKAHSIPNIKVSGTTPFKYDLRFMANKNEELLISILDKLIDTLNKKEIETIEDNYFRVEMGSHIDYSLVYKFALGFSVCILLFGLYNYRLQQEIKKRKLTEEKLYLMATTDSLTQIYNRSHIDNIFKEQLLITKRYLTPLSIVFFDIDGFKRINDTFGHNVADTVLIDLAYIVKSNLRETDYVGRWGGEEFLIVLTQTNLEQAAILAKHLKEKIEMYAFQINEKVTCSFGVTQINQDDTQSSAISRADDLMYFVKSHGKNGIKVG